MLTGESVPQMKVSDKLIYDNTQHYRAEAIDFD